MVDWEQIKQAYEQVKAGRVKGLNLSNKIKVQNATVYTMGPGNPVIRIDIKEQG